MNINFRVLLTTIIAVSLFSNSGNAQEMDTSKPLSLEECVAYALENNYNLRSTRLEEAIAETQVGETRSMGLPQAKFQSNLNYNYEVQKAFLPNALFPEDPNNPNPPDPEGFTAVQFSPTFDGNASFSVSQLLFDGSYFVGLQAAKTLRDLRRKESNQSEIEIVEAVSKAYYLVLINLERKELVNANLKQLEKVLSDTKAQYESGFAERIDVDRIQVSLNNIITENNSINRNLAYSYDLLKFQMGIPVSNEITLSGDLSSISFRAEEYLGTENEFDYEDRSEYNILKVNEELAGLDLRNNKATHLPRLSANFSYGWNTGANNTSEFFDFNDRWLSFGVVGVSLQWDLFTGLNRSSKMQKNRIQLEQLGIQKEQLENSIDMEIMQLKGNLESANESMEVQKQNMELAQSVYDQTQEKYKVGVGSNTELLDAEIASKEAQTNYYNALYEAIISKIELEKALGILYK
ncbi:TolC family protein [Marivirga sp. S37H4]|uniref:TolC family protein n=1 Tax=Marivirga aurantiaca TaxID=2802615 RepID=A0A934WWM9_9BACT|nr:TolC family protein [Marivirga aurantiaca]MBK6264291.1 TolC family protein [Marivirga aurantiaca]